jgi:hypothetical protein
MRSSLPLPVEYEDRIKNVKRTPDKIEKQGDDLHERLERELRSPKIRKAL